MRGIGVPALEPRFNELCLGNRYTTTLHVINSAVVKLGKLQKAEKVYRGMAGGVRDPRELGQSSVPRASPRASPKERGPTDAVAEVRAAVRTATERLAELEARAGRQLAASENVSGFAALTRLAELEARAGRHLAATRTAALTSISDAEIDSLVEAPVIGVATTTELPRYGGFSHGKPWSLQDEISKTLGDRFSCMQ